MSVALLFCSSCGSHLVDVRRWISPAVAELACASCRATSRLSGFTVGRVWRDDESDIITAAIDDAAIPRQAVR